MEKNTNFLKTLNMDFFEYPQKSLKNKITAFKFSFAKVPIIVSSPVLLVSNKTCALDKQLLSTVIVGNYLILKDSVVRSIYNGTLSKTDYNSLLKNIETLKSNGYSLLIFPEKDYTVFGKTGALSQEISNLMYDTGYDITFLSLVNTYFSMPLWSTVHRRCDTKCVKQNTIAHSRLDDLYQKEQLELFNKCMPSSAATYAEKHHLLMRSNQLAEKIERVVYCCPRCKTLFSVYSEFNCLKCRNCGSAVEFQNDGKFEFTQDIYSFDNLDDFMFEQLQEKHFMSSQEIVRFNNVKMLDASAKKETWKNVSFAILFGELHIKTEDKTLKYFLSNIIDLELLPNNTLNVYLKKEKLTFKGENGECFYFLIHLHKLLQFS